MAELTAQRLREVLYYDPETGIFTWRAKTGSKSAGSIAGTPHKDGYYTRIQVDRRCYPAHRLAWLYMTGEYPTGEIDHRNTIGTENRFDNLRLADHFVNMQNQRTAHRSNKSTGLLGAYRQGTRYRARIRHEGRNVSLGMFATPESAHRAYVQAKREMHPGCTL